MMRRILLFLLLILFLCQGSVLAFDKQEMLTAVRWATHTDAATGSKTVRLVVDVTDKVIVNSQLISSPTPRLLVNIQGAKPGMDKNTFDFDGKIVDKVNFNVSSDTSTQMIIDLPEPISSDEYKVFTLKSNPEAKKPFRVVVDITKNNKQPTFNFTAGLKGKTITIDPGHGGSDPGAIGPSKIMEKNITLAVAGEVQKMLEKAGAKVIMTRSRDTEVSTPSATDVQELSARTDIANNKAADLFISIHCNSFTNRDVGGTATYYYQKSQYDYLLAQSIQTNLVSKTGLQDRGVQKANFYVVKHTQMPAVLVELAFISNPREEKLLNSAYFQKQAAQGIVNGIDKFFTAASSREVTAK